VASEKILVCDDDERNLLLCVEMLERENYQVKAVRNGQAAIDLARKEHFDLLLVDFRMPGLNGLETFQAVREFDPETVGVIITGYGTFSIATDAIKSGFQRFITKPFTYEELVFAISETLKKNKLEKEVIAYRQAARLKDDFLALISHELRTPAALLMSSARLISNVRAGEAGNKERAILSVLQKESNRLGRIISNLILMCELKFQSDEHHQEWIKLDDIIAKTIDFLKEDIREKGIIINKQVSKDLPDLFGVKSQIRQMVVNLLDNAVKFSGKGEKVTVRATKKGSHIQFEVEDTGSGIPEDKIAKIFNPFEQVEVPATRKVGGAGLGLAISKEIVTAHGGKIWAENLLEGGSRFIVGLPITNGKTEQIIPKLSD